LCQKRLTPLGREKDANNSDDKIFFTSNKSSSNNPAISQRRSTIDPKVRIGRAILKETEADGQQFRARHVRAIIEKDSEMKRYHDHIKFLCEVDGNTADDIYTYNHFLDLIERY
jgi:hypothetical protein